MKPMALKFGENLAVPLFKCWWPLRVRRMSPHRVRRAGGRPTRLKCIVNGRTNRARKHVSRRGMSQVHAWRCIDVRPRWEFAWKCRHA